jgi:hypothetical protein
MPSFAAVSRERHGDKRWLSFGSNFRFAAQTAVAPLVAAELPKAMMAFPIGFIRNGEAFNPAAILSFEPNRNFFVADDGRWIGAYQPAMFRSFPFRLIQTDDDKLTLCIDEESGLMSDGAEGEPFFEGEETGSRLKQVLQFLTQLERNRATTERACAALERHGVIKPWVITVKADEGERKVEGLFQIEEAALNALPIEAFDDLRQSGALLIAYCQLLSMQHLPILGRLANAHATQRQEVSALMKQSFQSPAANEIDIDWSVFSDDSLEKGTT